MRQLQFDNIEALCEVHYSAVKDYVCRLPGEVLAKLKSSVEAVLGQVFPDDYSWLRAFILADHRTMSSWVSQRPESLKFQDFKILYLTRFANGASKFVDSAGTYNAYSLLEGMDIDVCPYCDDERMPVIEIDGKKKRICEFDHFFPKADDKFPALAMCFYNLIPSGQACNGLKSSGSVSANPYDADIEELTVIRPDLPVGILMDLVPVEDCKVSFHARGPMVDNVRVLGLEERYGKYDYEAHSWLKKRQSYSEDKLVEISELLGKSIDQLREDFFGRPYSFGSGKDLHAKMKHDLIGY